MEPAAAWAPCQFQLPDWSLEEPAAGGLPVEYASIDMQPGTCGLQAYVPGQQQLLECYYYSAASQHSDATSEKAKISTDSHATSVVNQVVGDFQDDIDKTERKMHRYPACLGAVDKCYTEPRIVAIGPYYHGRQDLKQAEKVKQTEKVKHAAACYCVKRSGRLLGELYEALVPVADDARRFYDKNVMAGISVDDFRHMMFFDACFLVQFMLVRVCGPNEEDPSLHGFFSPNRIDIFHDVMLLENQLPWKVVETVINFLNVRSILPEKFVSKMRYCMLPDRFDELLQQKPFIWYDSYRPPHLLGLLRYHIVGRSDDNKVSTPKLKNIIFSMSAIKLAKIGIKLTANNTMALTDMGLQQEGTIFPKLSLASLALDLDRASYLVNMAALELCSVKSFGMAPEEDSAVCSYLTLLAMLVCREEDVHQLREMDLLEGGGGLTNEEALRFFASLQGMRFGRCYYRIMKQIESYKENRWLWAWLHEFFYNYWKIIITVVTAIGTVVGIIVPILSIKRG